MRVQCLFFLFVSVFVCKIESAENYFFRHYTNRNGLSHNTVYCSLQDKKGFMWFGTEDGLNRFDSHSFQVFRHNARINTNTTLLNDRIISLFEDSSGKVWICTGGGVCYYDYETDLFHPFMLDPESGPYYADQIYEDDRGDLWLQSHHHITRYNTKDKSFRTFNTDEFNFRSVAMTMAEGGNPVFADATSLYSYNQDNQAFNKLFSIQPALKNELSVIQSILEIPHVGFFVGTDLEGLMMYHSNTGRIETIIPDIYVRAIIPYSTNIYWIASESGIYIYNLYDKSVVNLRKSLTNDYTIADNAVYSLTKDREGGIWVGSFFGGINYLPKDYTRFTYYIGGKTHAGMLGNTVREICPDKYGNLWLGTEDNGINCFDPETNTMLNYSLLNPEHKLSATNIHGLYADGDTLWIGFFNKGIELLHIPTRKIIKHYTLFNTNNNLSSNFILCFYKTGNGQFLIGTNSGALIYNRDVNTFSKWGNIGALIRQFLEDKDGNIWISTNNGLYKYPSAGLATEGFEKQKSVRRYTETSIAQKDGLGSSNTTSIFEDSKGRIWVTTAYGFSLYNKLTDSFNRITTDDGLPSNMVYRIVEDDDHLFWISTANGLVHFNPETFVMHTYSYSDGLHETQFNYSSSYRAPDGTIYMGTINGMISFNPKQFTKDTYTPPLYITRIYVHDSPKKSSHLLQQSPDKPHELTLPYNSATFTISFIAPSYTSPAAIKYSYLLEGTDKEWIYLNENKEVTFASLSPGKYRFKVRSTNSSDLWQNNEQLLYITITPPLWATTWAFFIYALLLIGSAILFYKYKKRNLFRKVQRSQELFEIEKDKELYTAKIQFFTFITHEIRTPLTLIKAPLEKIIRSDDGNETTRKNLIIIEKNTQRLLDLSNQLLDFRKTESRGFKLNFVKTNITLTLDHILAPFIPAFQNEQKNFSTDIPEKQLFAYIDRDAFTKIITNLLTNALKYSSHHISVKLELLPEEDQKFRVVVTNDGFIVPEKERENIFTAFHRLKETENIQGSGIGLSLSRTLTEFHNGSLIYQATAEGLNQFILTLPVKQNDYSFDLIEESVTSEKTALKKSDRPTILIAEDQPDMLRFIAEELNTTYDILEAENGKEALSILSRNNVNLIISDIMMPVMDGFEFCNNVKNDINFSHIPFILLTAQYNLQSRLTGLNQGADAYMEKPFSIEHLSAQISSLLKNREILRKSYLEKPFISSTSLASSTVDNLFLQKLNTYIEDNLTNEHLSVDMIASEMNMSNSSLYRKVKGLSDLSPVDFIRMARLKKAIQLMQSGEKRISEIAFSVGFSSPAYFSTSFQKQYGKSPSEFLKELE